MGITQFNLPPTHEPYLPLVTPQPQSITASFQITSVRLVISSISSSSDDARGDHDKLIMYGKPCE